MPYCESGWFGQLLLALFFPFCHHKSHGLVATNVLNPPHFLAETASSVLTTVANPIIGLMAKKIPGDLFDVQLNKAGPANADGKVGKSACHSPTLVPLVLPCWLSAHMQAHTATIATIHICNNIS